MSSDQYVESVKQMMNQQNVFFSIFLAILAIVLTFVGVIQWRLSSKQIELIKQQTKEELEKEIALKLGVQEIIEFPKENRKYVSSKIESVQAESQNNREALEKLRKQIINKENLRIRNDVVQASSSKEPNLYNFEVILHTYQELLDIDLGLFNYYLNNLSSWISNNDVLSIKDEVFRLNRMIEKMKDIEPENIDPSKSELLKFKAKLERVNPDNFKSP